MKIGVAGPVNLGGTEIRRRIPLIEQAGIDSVCFYEVPLEQETLARAGYVAALSDNVKIGTGIFSPLVRHPALIAMAAATIDDLSNGRSIITMGAGIRNWVEERMRIPYTQAKETLEAAITTIRQLLAGQIVDCKNEVFGVCGKLEYPPHRREVPIYIAAGHERMLRLAGRVAEGALLYFWPPIGYVRWAAQQVKRTSGGRRAEIGAFMPLRITRDKEKVRRELKSELAFYFSDPESGPLFLEKGGFESRLGPALREVWGSPDYRPRVPEPFMKVIPDELVDEFSLIGSVEDIRERLASYEEAGMTFVVLAFQSMFDEYIGQISELSP